MGRNKGDAGVLKAIDKSKKKKTEQTPTKLNSNPKAVIKGINDLKKSGMVGEISVYIMNHPEESMNDVIKHFTEKVKKDGTIKG
jgi:MoaA/NifB/PqqE/SkfB family radical SAM enzyme